MKKLLSGIVAIALILGLATSVNAATMTAPTTAKEGDTIVVRVNAEKATDNIGAWVSYDAEAFEFVSANSNVGAVEANAADGVVKTAADANKDIEGAYMSLTFKAKKTVTDASFATTKLITSTSEAAPAAVKVTVTENTAKKDPVAGDPKADPKAENNTTDSAKVDANGNKITKLPQTGVNTVAIAGAALAVIAGAVVLAKRN